MRNGANWSQRGSEYASGRPKAAGRLSEIKQCTALYPDNTFEFSPFKSQQNKPGSHTDLQKEASDLVLPFVVVVVVGSLSVEI